jgi:hypothetical protein
MKFGVREICDVVLKAKANQKVGDKIFYKNEPVIYFDTLKTSSMEGAATTVYAQGGRGNSRLVAWEGERTITFTMEDALISPAGFMILSGAGLIDGKETPIQVHTTERVKVEANGTIKLSDVPYTGTVEDNNKNEDWIYVMILDDNGEIKTEPYIYVAVTKTDGDEIVNTETITLKTANQAENAPKGGDVVLVDYYVTRAGGAQQINITPDKFGGNYYLEASTLFRDTNGVDMPAEFIIPNCKIQSNFTFTMASSGDPSSFTFTMDAFPDYTRFDKTKKVLAAIQIITEDTTDGKVVRESTQATLTHSVNKDGIIEDTTKNVTSTAASGTIIVDGKTYITLPQEGNDLSFGEDDTTITLNGKHYTLTEAEG